MHNPLSGTLLSERMLKYNGVHHKPCGMFAEVNLAPGRHIEAGAKGRFIAWPTAPAVGSIWNVIAVGRTTKTRAEPEVNTKFKGGKRLPLWRWWEIE